MISSADKQSSVSYRYDTCSLPPEIVKKQKKKKMEKTKTKVCTRVDVAGETIENLWGISIVWLLFIFLYKTW